MNMNLSELFKTHWHACLDQEDELTMRERVLAKKMDNNSDEYRQVSAAIETREVVIRAIRKFFLESGVEIEVPSELLDEIKAAQEEYQRVRTAFRF